MPAALGVASRPDLGDVRQSLGMVAQRRRGAPGTSSVAHPGENVAGAGLELTDEDPAEIASLGAS